MKKHEIIEQVKLLQSESLGELEEQINRFKKEHKVNTLYRSVFHHGPREVGANKPFYRQVLLRGIERFGYTVSKCEIITKRMK